MTEFVIELLRLRGDERWDDWGDRWWEHADILGLVREKRTAP